MTDQKYPSLSDLADISLLDDKAEKVSFSAFIGKRVLIFFFPRAGTPGCTTQACGFRDAFPKIQEANATVIGISPDMPKALAKWRANQHLPYVLLSDPEHKVAERFHAWGERSLYGRKFLGIIRSHFVFGTDGVLETAEVKVSPKDSIDKGVKALIK